MGKQGTYRLLRNGTRAATRLLVMSVCLALGAVSACEMPEPTRDAVLAEGYLVLPGAVATSVAFTQGSQSCRYLDGGDCDAPSRLGHRLELERPTPAREIVGWYAANLSAANWRQSDENTFGKLVGDRCHWLTVEPLARVPQQTVVRGSPGHLDVRGHTPEGDELATSYSTGYTIGYAGETSRCR